MGNLYEVKFEHEIKWARREGTRPIRVAKAYAREWGPDDGDRILVRGVAEVDAFEGKFPPEPRWYRVDGSDTTAHVVIDTPVYEVQVRVVSTNSYELLPPDPDQWAATYGSMAKAAAQNYARGRGFGQIEVIAVRARKTGRMQEFAWDPTARIAHPRNGRGN